MRPLGCLAPELKRPNRLLTSPPFKTMDGLSRRVMAAEERLGRLEAPGGSGGSGGAL